jgi:hypothetical protein
MATRRAYRAGDIVIVRDRMQSGYRYVIAARPGRGFAPDFKPHFTPKELLALGVFEGKYCNDCQAELPGDWFVHARLSDRPNPSLNCFGVKSRLSLSEWRARGWIVGPDPRGWFQWYCRYWIGRRLPEVDQIQIKRWRAFARHTAQVRKNCKPGDLFCRPRQRQALLQWAYNPFI